MSDTVVLDGSCKLVNQCDGSCTLTSVLDGVAQVVVQVSNYDYYQGDYVVTPSSETQTLNTYGLMMGQNVTINPIPSNYGLITWNGSTLTVS